MKTNRILLRNFITSDLEDIYNYSNNSEMSQSIEETKVILNSLIFNKNSFAIVYNNKVIGSIVIKEELEFNNAKSISFVISKEYWGLGIAFEATKEIINYCFNNNIENLTMTCCKTNKQAKRVIEKCNLRLYKLIDDKYKFLLEKKNFNKFFSNNFNYIKSNIVSLRLIKQFYTNNISLSFYYYNIINNKNKVVGKISIRIGNNYHSYYNGHIGYEIDKEYRGNNYAYYASLLVLDVARYHKMEEIYLSSSINNIPSNKIINKLNSVFLEEVVIPKDYFGYYEGISNHNIYKLKL